MPSFQCAVGHCAHSRHYNTNSARTVSPRAQNSNTRFYTNWFISILHSTVHFKVLFKSQIFKFVNYIIFTVCVICALKNPYLRTATIGGR